jgi:hypothetical protein
VQGRRRGSCGTEDGGELRTQRRTPASCGWEGRRRAADMQRTLGGGGAARELQMPSLCMQARPASSYACKRVGSAADPGDRSQILERAGGDQLLILITGVLARGISS